MIPGCSITLPISHLLQYPEIARKRQGIPLLSTALGEPTCRSTTCLLVILHVFHSASCVHVAQEKCTYTVTIRICISYFQNLSHSSSSMLHYATLCYYVTGIEALTKHERHQTLQTSSQDVEEQLPKGPPSANRDVQRRVHIPDILVKTDKGTNCSIRRENWTKSPIVVPSTFLMHKSSYQWHAAQTAGKT